MKVVRRLSVALGVAAVVSATVAHGEPPFDPRADGREVTVEASRIVVCSTYEEFSPARVQEFFRQVFPSRPVPDVVDARSGHGADGGATAFIYVASTAPTPEDQECLDVMPSGTSAFVAKVRQNDRMAQDHLTANLAEVYGDAPVPLGVRSAWSTTETGAGVLTVFLHSEPSDPPASILPIMFGLDQDFCDASEAC